MLQGTATALPLVEGRALDPALVNGVAPDALTLGAGRDATIRFVDEVAAFQNALGVYLIAPDGTNHDPTIAFASRPRRPTRAFPTRGRAAGRSRRATGWRSASSTTPRSSCRAPASACS